MEVKPGYKQTEAGIIPEDWHAKRLADIGRFSKGLGIKKDESLSGTIPCIRYGEIYTHHNYIIKKFNSFISSDVAKTSQKLNIGDILFAGSGETKEEIAKAVAFTQQVEAYAGGDIVILTPKSTNSTYLGYALNSPSVIRQKASKGQGDAVVHITPHSLGEVVLPIPSQSEQSAIAMALSDMDALLESLNSLIAKKRAIKQAAIQQLLSKKSSLREHQDRWQIQRLGDLATMSSGGTPSSGNPEYYGGDIPWVSISDMTKGGKFISQTDRNLTTLGLKNSAAKIFPQNTVLYSMYASLGECSIANVPTSSSQAILGIQTGNNLIPRFLYHYLHYIKPTIISLGQQGTQSNLNKSMVQNFLIPTPPLEEQAEISKIIDDMDNEIETINRLKIKNSDLKQTMAQALLTGQIRLKNK